MGPPPFGDGNEASPRRRFITNTCLQWGHRLSAMETRHVFLGRFGRSLPSMGPPPFGDGNISQCTAFINRMGTFNGATAFRRWKLSYIRSARPPELNLQWGHRLSAMETCQSLANELGVDIPSMGPPPFGDGNGKQPRCTPQSLPTFNGATAFRRWKQLLPQEHQELDGNSFNGATAFRRWKLSVLVPKLLWPSRPSMGPPPFGDGNMHLDRHWQRGHSPSMGPPPFGDGNLYQHDDRKETAQPCLQWGHRLSAMETSIASTQSWDCARYLQWGHRLSAMETASYWSFR